MFRPGKTDVQKSIFDRDTVTKCPHGHAPFYTVYEADKERYTAKFDKRYCNSCPLRDHCQVKEQKKVYHLAFTEKKRRTDKTWAKQGTERHKQLSNFRAGIEEVPSVLKRAYRLNDLPIRGRVRSKIWIFASVIAQNFKRCTKYRRKIAPATV